MTSSDRNARQRDIIPPDRLAATSATVIGVGAIGRQIALQLAAIGIPQLTLIDHDTVEPINLGPQGYLAEDLGRPKVAATAELCHRMNPQLDITTATRRFRRSDRLRGVVFVGVDSIIARRLIWATLEPQMELTSDILCHMQQPADRINFFADCRMAGEVIRVLTVADARSQAHYPRTLFDQREAHAAPCTARSTIFTANIAAGLAVHMFARHLRGLRTEADLMLNLLAGEMSVAAFA